jgi:precorrin-2/cobalt-factor-2 C20-methyltransferase
MNQPSFGTQGLLIQIVVSWDGFFQEVYMSRGKLWGVGVGPGDPDLMTVKAVRCIKEADVVAVPAASVKKPSTALTAALPYIEDKEKIHRLLFPMTRDPAILEQAWDEAGKQVSAWLKEGKQVAFLTLGDPMFYSTFVYLCEHVPEDSSWEAVPGIPAFLASASRLGRPAAMKEESLVVLTGTMPAGTINEFLHMADEAVIMKVYKNWRQIRLCLLENDLLEQAVMVCRAGLPDEKVIRDLTALPDDFVPDYLSTVLTGRNESWNR